jgi:precorrin-6B methylase 2
MNNMFLKNNRLILLLSLSAITLLALIIKYPSTQQKLFSTQEIEQIIANAFQDENGFSICGDEREYIEKCGGNPTYGEILPESLAQLIKKLELTKKDVLFDLGSGAGKVCIQVALTSPAKAVGIELSSTRHALAQKIKQKIIGEYILTDAKKLEFIEGNITEFNLCSGTVFFMCSTCFSDELMKTLTQKLEKIPHLIKIVSLRTLPVDVSSVIKLIDTLSLPMSWSDASSVYIYEKR